MKKEMIEMERTQKKEEADLQRREGMECCW
jgi:hypothetical protein